MAHTSLRIQGKITEVYTWVSPLSMEVLAAAYAGFDQEPAYGLLAYYLMEEGREERCSDITSECGDNNAHPTWWFSV